MAFSTIYDLLKDLIEAIPMLTQPNYLLFFTQRLFAHY